jgi:uncharacterized damage-inducible protein DinB
MSLCDTLRSNIRRSINLYEELVTELPEEALSLKLAQPSNTIGEQLWCVIGARESYCRAITAGQWSGFNCSLDAKSVGSRQRVLEALSRSAGGIESVLGRLESYTDAQNQLVADLLEHEIVHHGQLIRYLYGLKLSIPAGWKARYALD